MCALVPAYACIFDRLCMRTGYELVRVPPLLKVGGSEVVVVKASRQIVCFAELEQGWYVVPPSDTTFTLSYLNLYLFIHCFILITRLITFLFCTINLGFICIWFTGTNKNSICINIIQVLKNCVYNYAE